MSQILSGPAQSARDVGAAPATQDDLGSRLPIVWIVLGTSILLSLLFATRYTQFLLYVRDTLGTGTAPIAWTEPGLSPEECVDRALEWAAECRGIKSLCDEYVPRVTRECLSQSDRTEYCAALGRTGETTAFGFSECAARGVRREVDAEACSGAYRAIDEFCRGLRLDAGFTH